MADDGTQVEARAGAPPPAGDPARPLPHCPACGTQLLTLAGRCHACAGDVHLLVRLIGMADQYYNRAVLAARKKHWGEAAEHLAVTLALRADDADALVLLGKVRVKQKNPGLAVAAWEEALRHSPGREDAAEAIAHFRRPTRRGRRDGKAAKG